MKREIKRKKFFYKRAKFLDKENKLNLEEALRFTLKELKSVGKRKETFGDNNNFIRLILDHNIKETDMLFGVIASLEKGNHQPVISDNDDAETLSIQQVAPTKGDDNIQREFIEGLCFFGIQENHVVVMASRSLGAADMEHHINWLLRNSSRKTNQVILADHPTKATIAKIKQYGIRQIDFGQELITDTKALPGEKKEIEKTELFEVSSKWFELLKEIIGESASGINLADALKGNIEVLLSIKHKARSGSMKSQEFMEKIATGLRHVDESNVNLRLGKGKEVKGSDLKHSEAISISTYGGIPDSADVYKKMREWLIAQLENKIIDL